MSLRLSLIVLAGLLLCGAPAHADEVLVRLKPACNPGMKALAPASLSYVSSMQPAFHPANAALAAKVGLDRWYVTHGKAPSDMIRTLSKDPAVDLVQPEQAVHLAMVPNDPLFSQQWSLNNTGAIYGVPGADIHAEKAWGITTGSNSVTVALLDTGIDIYHPDLAPALVPGYNFVSNTTNTNDDYGHGTNCAGIIGAVGNNSLLMTGVCWNVKLMPVKVISSNGSGQDNWMANGIVWATDHHANVISMSLVFNQDDPAVDTAVAYALNAGVTVVAAMGNDGSNTMHWPAATPGVIAVGASTGADQRASFSDYNSYISVVAPGANILTTQRGSGLRSPEIRQTIPVTPGHQYQLSAWVNTQGSPNTCSAFLEWKNGADPGADGLCTTLSSLTNNTSGWTQMTATVKPTTTSLTLCLALSWLCENQGGGGNFDNASVIDLTSGSRDLLTNSSFEDNGGSTSGWVGDLNTPDNNTPPPGGAQDGAHWVGASCVPQLTTSFTGTSASTPMVAGICALVLSVNKTVTPAQMKMLIQQGADDLPPYGFDIYTGYGRANAYATLLALQDKTPPTQPVVISAAYTDNPSQLSFSWAPSTDSETGIIGYDYAIGTPGNPTSVRTWAWMGNATNFTATGLSLVPNQIYIISVRAKNGAHLYSTPGASGNILFAPDVSGISTARGMPDGTYITLTGKVVTAVLPDRVWIEDPDRTATIAVEGASANEGDVVSVSGKLGTQGCFRVITSAQITVLSTMPVPNALGMRQSALGGGPLSPQLPGISGGIGLYNIGQLVRVWGRVTQSSPTDFYVDDGSGVIGFSGVSGVDVLTNGFTQPQAGWMVQVTGIVECQTSGGVTKPVVRIRRDTDVIRLN